jgi:acetyltransferase-like isoleucine patch superfamily enzyme
MYHRRRQPSLFNRGLIVVVTDANIHPTSIIVPGAALGRNVTVGPFTVINANVSVGDGTYVDSHSILGAPTADYYADMQSYEPAPCSIGRNSVIRSHSVLYQGVTCGDDFQCGPHVTIREGTSIGVGVRVGTSCDLQPEVSIGDYSRLHSNVFVARSSVIEDLVWLFPYALLLDDPHPPSDTCTKGPTIRRFAVVGARSTISSAVEIGEGAVVGAASLVRHDVPAGTVVVGVPARVAGTTADVVCHDGRIDSLYPWWQHFRRGYPEGVLPDAESSPDD